MVGRGVGVDEEEGVWVRHEGCQEEGSCIPDGGIHIPSLMELMGSLERELALGMCDWRELAVSAARVFISELE